MTLKFFQLRLELETVDTQTDLTIILPNPATRRTLRAKATQCPLLLP